MSDINLSQIKKSGDYHRYLALECIERANSGHPGLPLGCADLGVLLYRYILDINPEDGEWANRDRFILSAGHGSMFLYPLLYSAGFNMTLDDLANFRQLHSKTPGHPEYELELGIETTAGPLGQGIAASVGTAIEGKMLAQRFNEKGYNLFDYTVYVLMGDGCVMEGINYEAASLAGHLGLDNLIAIYDSNHITIDGNTEITFTEDTAKRYEAQGWLVEKVDGTDHKAVYAKLRDLKGKKGKPKLLIMTTTIGEGLNKKRDTSGIHGAPAGLDEIAYFVQHSEGVRALFEAKYGKEAVNDTDKLKALLEERIKKPEPLMEYPEHLEFMKEGVVSGQKAYKEWKALLDGYKKAFPEKYELLKGYMEYTLPASLREKLLNYSEEKGDATRGISGKVLNLCAEALPQLVGGTADLVGSTKATVKGSGYIGKEDFSGRNIAFGVREHAMAALGNGLAFGKMMIPFTSTFFTFFDYMKPSVRLAALMGLNHLFVFSHDSIYVGEDGPTHQPIEHLNAIRLIPRMHTFRPGSDAETAFSFLYFLENMNGPVALVTTRQKFSGETFGTSMGRSREELYADFSRGGYIFYETTVGQKPDVILCGSGSELDLALSAAKLIEERDKKLVRVVSIPCMELLEQAGDAYREALFGGYRVPVYMIEAGSYRGVGLFFDRNVELISIDDFGVSAPGGLAAAYFGLTPEAVYERIMGS